MKRTLAAAACAALCITLVAPALAAETPAAGAPPAQKTKGEMAKGTITKWDDATKSFTVKLEVPMAGLTEVSLSWTDKTKLQGAGKVGETVLVKYSTETGKPVAHSIMVGKDAIAQWEARKKQQGSPS
jgi:Cu/Ag efflux protein CusF